MKSSGPTFDELARDIRARRFAPVYVLMGEESYFIDRLSALIEQYALSDDERDFNQTVLYGADTTAVQIIDAASRYPVMAQRQLVVVREAQSAKDMLEALVPYAESPNPATVLVICYRNGTLDRRRRFPATVARNGVIFESNRLYDSQLPAFVSNWLRQRGLSIERSAADLLCDSVGADLSRLAKELDKLCLALPEGVKEVTASLVAEQVGQGREYNAFSLIDALVVKDAAKAMRIVNYFGSAPRNFALQPVTSALFTFFGNLLVSYYAPDRSESGVAAFVGVNPVNVRRVLMPAQKNFSARKVLQIIRFLRLTDARSKGIDCPCTSDYDLLRDLVYVILH